MRSSKSRSLDGPSKRKIFVTLGLILLILTSFFGGYFTQFALRGSGEKVVGDIVHVMDQVGYVYDAENDVYVKIEGDKIAKLIAGNFLDGYSAYYTKEEYAEIQKKNSGNYYGFGISILANKSEWENSNTNYVYSVSINSPAYKAGLIAGDKIVGASIEGQPYVDITNGKELNDFLESVEQDVQVVFSVERGGFTKEITCAKEKYVACYVIYEDSEVKAHFAPMPTDKMVTWQDALNVISVEEKINNIYTDDIGYIKLTAFEGDAALQFGAAIEYMVSRGRTKLVLDLCDNGGGSMTILQDVASYLVYNKGKANAKIAYATEKLDANDETGYLVEGFRTTAYYARVNNTKEEIVEISVMANQNTASASECLIGALISFADREPKENEIDILPNNGEAFYSKNFVVVDDDGDGQYRTYGKGIMQTTYKLSSGGAIKLTTAKIVWPDENQTCIHKKGIYPLLAENGVDTRQQGLEKAIALLCD